MAEKSNRQQRRLKPRLQGIWMEGPQVLGIVGPPASAIVARPGRCWWVKTAHAAAESSKTAACTCLNGVKDVTFAAAGSAFVAAGAEAAAGAASAASAEA